MLNWWLIHAKLILHEWFKQYSNVSINHQSSINSDHEVDLGECPRSVAINSAGIVVKIDVSSMHTTSAITTRAVSSTCLVMRCPSWRRCLGRNGEGQATIPKMGRWTSQRRKLHCWRVIAHCCYWTNWTQLEQTWSDFVDHNWLGPPLYWCFFSPFPRCER